MSLLTSQMTSKMSTAYSGLSALIQAATSQLGDLAETSTSDANSPEGSPPLLSNPTTPILEDAHLDLDETSSWHRNDAGAATVTPLLTSVQEQGTGTPAKFCFPEVLMLLLANPANEDIVTFLPDGKYFAIRRLDFANELLNKHFKLKKFEDFLEETRGWGFIRVNGNINEDCNSTGGNTNNGNCNESSKSNSSTSKADIFVFRHPHFEKNQQVDMGKIRFRTGDIGKCQKHNCFSPGDKAKPRIVLEKNANSKVNNTKRQLSPSNTSGNVEDNRQRLRIESKPLLVDADQFLLSDSSCQQPTQLRRRSSSELRGVAEAITASKIHLNNTREVTKEGDSSNQDSPMIYDTDSTIYPRSGPDHWPPQLERRQSTGSSLVDGGVETATQNIVTDAIEALLFDESHTRETYHRHEKELSVSSLPGVVPISKQLFSASENNNATSSNAKINKDEASGTRKKKSNGRSRKVSIKKKSQHVSSSSSWVVRTTIGSLEDASRSNCSNLSSSSFSSNTNLRVIIPSDGGGAQQQRTSTDSSMVVSPARMEAAAALVSQSRNRND
jgi:hypothetical protein